MAEEAWQATEAGRHLAGRRKRDTEPELMLRRALHAQGGRFRLQVRLAKGCTPDVLMPSRGLAIFVDGCYWHSCPLHGRKTPFTGPNAALWEAKFRRNRARDERSSYLAESLGWIAVRVWECDVRSDADGVAAGLLARPIETKGRHKTA